MPQKFLLTLIQQELCLYLDEERNAVGAGLRRDDGDGSSSSTNPDEAASIPHPSGNIIFIYFFIIYYELHSKGESIPLGNLYSLPLNLSRFNSRFKINESFMATWFFFSSYSIIDFKYTNNFALC